MSVQQATSYPEGDSKKTQILAVLIITTTLALIAFVLRMYTRLCILHKSGWDDYTMTAAMVFAMVVLAFESMAVHHGIGTHKMYLTPDQAIEAAKWSTLSITPNVLATMMARISLCILILRIVGGVKLYRIFLVGIIVGTVVVGTLTVLNTYITCNPLEKMWNTALPGYCNGRSRYAIGMTQSVWTIAADWLVAAFPILMLRRLQMAFRTKVALATIMCLGFLIGVIVLLKTLKVNALFSHADSTYDTADLSTWSLVEQNVGILIVNVPGIRPLFSKVFALTKKSSKPGSGGYNHGGYRMDDFSGLSKRSHGFRSGVVATAARKPGQPDPSGSESSLVAKNLDGGMGITKTLDVSVHSYRPDQDREPQRDDEHSHYV